MKTTSYEISKKLKEAGFEAESDFYWYCYDKGQEMRHIANADGKGNVKAYDLQTLFDALPKETEIIISNYTGKRIFYLGSWWRNIRGNEISITIEENESLADTAGKMWLLLKEKGLI